MSDSVRLSITIPWGMNKTGTLSILVLFEDGDLRAGARGEVLLSFPCRFMERGPPDLFWGSGENGVHDWTHKKRIK